MALNHSNFLVSLANEINRITAHFVFDGYQALASTLQAPLGALIVLYIVLMGYAMVRGIIDKPQQELFKFAIKTGAIYMFAMNWSFFSSYLVELFVAGTDSLATALMRAVHKQGSASSITQSLQNVLNEIIELGSMLFEAGSFRKLTPYFAGIMVFFSGCATVGLAFIEIVVAKFMVSITLCTAPLFIIFILFEQTKSLFERWLSVLISFSLVLIFVSAVVGLCAYLLHWVTASILKETTLTAAIWIPLFMVSSLCIMSIFQAVYLGKSIGGAFHSAGASSMVSNFTRSMRQGFQTSRKTVGQGLGKTASILQTATKPKNTFKQMQKNLRGNPS